jgi:hypothetical protein
MYGVCIAPVCGIKQVNCIEVIEKVISIVGDMRSDLKYVV